MVSSIGHIKNKLLYLKNLIEIKVDQKSNKIIPNGRLVPPHFLQTMLS